MRWDGGSGGDGRGGERKKNGGEEREAEGRGGECVVGISTYFRAFRHCHKKLIGK